jgi:hypothetical protein
MIFLGAFFFFFFSAFFPGIREVFHIPGRIVLTVEFQTEALTSVDLGHTIGGPDAKLYLIVSYTSLRRTPFWASVSCGI